MYVENIVKGRSDLLFNEGLVPPVAGSAVCRQPSSSQFLQGLSQVQNTA